MRFSWVWPRGRWWLWHLYVMFNHFWEKVPRGKVGSHDEIETFMNFWKLKNQNSFTERSKDKNVDEGNYKGSYSKCWDVTFWWWQTREKIQKKLFSWKNLSRPESFQLVGTRWTFETLFIDLHLLHKSTKVFLKFEKSIFSHTKSLRNSVDFDEIFLSLTKR